ncbi:hypothetical protein ABK040_006618 [Willaertia magna]
MKYTLQCDLSANIFLQKRLNLAKTYDSKRTVKKFYIHGELDDPIDLETFSFTWKLKDNNLLPSLKNKYWYLKKWNSIGILYHAKCNEFSLIYKPQLHMIRVEFEYITQFYNEKFQLWQEC